MPREPQSALTPRQALVYDLLPEKGDGYIREDVLSRGLRGLTRDEVRRTLDQLTRKGFARGFAAGFGPAEWRRAGEDEPDAA